MPCETRSRVCLGWAALFVAGACARANEPAPSIAPPAAPALEARALPTASTPRELREPTADSAPPSFDPVRLAQGYVDDALCIPQSTEPRVLAELDGPKRKFSVHGYLARTLRLERAHGEAVYAHCLSVAWPAGRRNTAGKRSRVAETIDEGWLRAIENTLARVPWRHVRTLHRVVIDNRPKEHGIAAFDRERADDGRDGHTIWLHEHLFLEPNHWARGTHGSYWSYHNNEDDQTLDEQPPEHALFSPVLLHELGHLVAYNVLDQAASGEVPACAKTCGESGGCLGVPHAEREVGCISPYCKPFRFNRGTENWAEQYRFYYQGSHTRELLSRAGSPCFELLGDEDRASRAHGAPWEMGLPDVSSFRRSLWDSCGGRACKPW